MNSREINAEIKRETSLAVLVEVPCKAGDEIVAGTIWLPKSQIDIAMIRQHYTTEIPNWLFQSKSEDLNSQITNFAGIIEVN